MLLLLPTVGELDYRATTDTLSRKVTRQKFLGVVGAGAAYIALLNTPGCKDARQGHRSPPARLPDEVRTFRSRPELSPPAVVPTGSGASEVGARGAAEQVLSGARNRLNNCLTERVLQHLGAMQSLKSADAAA
jgi:hypothetical protein